MKKSALSSIVIAVVSLLCACTDDTIGDIKDPALPMSFKVADGDIPTDEISRGSVGTDWYAGTSALTSEDNTDTLYLSSYRTPGIRKNTKAKSRGEILNAETLPNFGAFADVDQTGKTYFANLRINHQGTVWMPEEKRFWPENQPLKLHFYAPYADVPSEEGITELPAKGMYGAYTLRYSVPSKIEDQIDLMWGTPVTASASPCDVTLHHALTSIRFVTGREMAPCTIKTITLSGIKSQGVLSLEDGQWTLDNTTTTYEIVCDKELPRGTNEFAVPGTPLSDDTQAMLLMPQAFDENAKITLTIEWNNGVETKPYNFETSLKGIQWYAGTTMTFRLSANPGIPVLRLEVIDEDTGVPLTEFTPSYVGGEKKYKVISEYDRGDGSKPIPVPWTASLLDKDGNPTTIEAINAEHKFITNFVEHGNGGEEECAIITILPKVRYNGKSDQTELLQSAQKVGSPERPHNLASLRIFNDESVHDDYGTYNTSNCYIVNAPGTYEIPLVYGNAIQGGKTATQAYRPNASLMPYHLVNHAGVKIGTNINGTAIGAADAPYICMNYEHDGQNIKYGDAKLVWSDQINVISDVHLSDNNSDKDTRIVFTVEEGENIRQCNSVIALTNDKGVVVWSWHIWITPLSMSNTESFIPVPCPDTQHEQHHHYIFKTNIGHIYAGDVVVYEAPKLTIRYTQQWPGDDDDDPNRPKAKSHDLVLNQQAHSITQREYFLLYQWGRKDPFMPNTNEMYDADFNRINLSDLKSFGYTFNEQEYGDNYASMAESITKPAEFMRGLDEYIGKFPMQLNIYLWNIGASTNEFESAGIGPNQKSAEKSVYDPSPVGCRVPYGQWIEQLAVNDWDGKFKIGYKWVSAKEQYAFFSFDYLGHQEFFINAIGFRNSMGHWMTSMDPTWYIWTAQAEHKTGFAKSIRGDKYGATLDQKPFTNAFGVRPMHVEDKTHHFYD